MKLRLSFALLVIFLFMSAVSALAQADTVIGQITNSNAETFIGGVSDDGRFVVFESRGNLATENPRNADGNLEIFLFDYAQRRIFQITDTKSVLFDTAKAATFDNIRVAIVNTRPVISNDGKWIAFSSNATTSTPAAPNSTNPGSFDGNAYTAPTPTPTPTPSPTPSPTATPTPGANPLTNDGNLEIWLYQIPSYAPVADLSAGDEVPFTDLSGGTFIQVTNTDASQLPRAGTSTVGPFIAGDNHDASINDDGSVIAFVSTRNLVAALNDTDGNDEIFSYVRASGTTSQITQTSPGPISNPIYNKNVTISGTGGRVVFASTGENPIVGFPACGSNPVATRNEQIFYADLNISTGAPTACKQITSTTPTTTGSPVNILDIGRRMSRDGRYIAFDSYADLANENGGKNYSSFALYLYDTMAATGPYRRIGPRSDADSAASGGDLAHYPGFTDTDSTGAPSTLVFETRENIKADGTIPSTASDGLNPDTGRPTQIYNVPITSGPLSFTRITKFPAPAGSFLASTQPMTTNAARRLGFNLAQTELGTGNSSLLSQAYYLIDPSVASQSTANISFATGATGLPIAATPATSPSPTPTPTPSPTPVTPASVTGMSQGMLGILSFDTTQPITSRTAVGSLSRRFSLPLELSGVTMAINGVGCGLRSVNGNQIVFVVPPAIPSTVAGSVYDVVVNNNGAVIRAKVTLVPARPDIFNLAGVVGPGGRAKLFNVTNRVHTTEPFAVTTIKIRGGVRVPTILRLYATGIANIDPASISIRIGSVTMTGTSVGTGGDLNEPGVYTVDFKLDPTLNGAGNQPVVLSVTSSSTTFLSRVDDTTSFVWIL